MNVVVDNRVFNRSDADFGVRYSPHGSNREFCTTTKDISGGGIRVNLLKKLREGTMVDLEIFKYDREIKIRARGKVAWINKEEINDIYDAGIEFLDTDLVNIKRLLSS